MEALTEVARQYYVKKLKGQLEDGLASSYGKALAKSKMLDKFAYLERYIGYLEYLNITGERNGLIRVVDGKPVGRIGNRNRKP